jgi:hypothetical protein
MRMHPFWPLSVFTLSSGCRISQAVVSLGMLLLPINPSTINFVATLSIELDNAPSTMASSDFLAAVQLRLEEQHMNLDS